MDFPTSQPDVGLVGGVFVDENPATGQPGSRIPAAWGNSVTRELLNVIEAAGLEPDDAKTDQLLQAIRTLVPERSAFARVSGTLTLPATAFGVYALSDGGAAATVTLPSVDDLVDDTELLLFANHANTAAIQVKADIGQAVQGPAALMGASTTAFMLPAGGDWVRLRSEKAQGRWVVVSSYANARMDMIDARVVTLEGRQKALGSGQETKDVSSLRAFNQRYYNYTGQSIEVNVGVWRSNSSEFTNLKVNAGSGDVVVSKTQGTSGGNYFYEVCAIVPNGASYIVDGAAPLSGAGMGLVWREMRNWSI